VDVSFDNRRGEKRIRNKKVNKRKETKNLFNKQSMSDGSGLVNESVSSMICFAGARLIEAALSASGVPG
jgi:hypothetical protein